MYYAIGVVLGWVLFGIYWIFAGARAVRRLRREEEQFTLNQEQWRSRVLFQRRLS